jgi:hypothetical protein
MSTKFVVSRSTLGKRDRPCKSLGSGCFALNARRPLAFGTCMFGKILRSCKYAEGGIRISWMGMYCASAESEEAAESHHSAKMVNIKSKPEAHDIP